MNNQKENKEVVNETEVKNYEGQPKEELNLPTLPDAPQPSYNEGGLTTVQDMFTGRSMQVFSSINAESREDKIKVYNAMNDNEAAIGDMVGKTIEVTDVVAFPVQMVDDATGELIDLVRVVLVDRDGKSYGSVAKGISSSIQKIVGVVGHAPWTPAIKVKPIEKKTRAGFKTLILALEA